MEERCEEVIEGENDFEVVYDEVYDPEREERLKEQLASSEGSLSAYWARCILI